MITLLKHLFKSFVVCTLSLDISIQSQWEYLFHLLHSVSMKTFPHRAAQSCSSVITCTLANLYPMKAYGRIIAALCQEKDLANASFKNPNSLPLTNDPEVLIGFKMSNYITAFLYRSFWLQIIHFFHAACHNYFIFIPALTLLFHSPLTCSHCDTAGKLKRALRPATQSFMSKRNFTPSSAILVPLNHVLIVLKKYYSSSGI